MARKYFEPTRAVREKKSHAQAQENSTTEGQSNGLWGELTWAKTSIPAQSRHGIAAEAKETTKEDLPPRMVKGTSPNYRGDPTVPSNQSAEIPDTENTSLWITRLPHGSTHSDLMETLHGRGKIVSTNITERGEDYDTAAATITFFRHQDAYDIKRAINNGSLRLQVYRAAQGDVVQQPGSSAAAAAPNGGPGYLIASGSNSAKTTGTHASKGSDQSTGVRLYARWNHVRVAELKLENNKKGRHPGGALLPSRVVVIRGPKETVSPGPMEALFKESFHYDLDRIIFLGTDRNGNVTYEYRFGSWKNQANFAVMTLSAMRDKRIKFEYGRDPCEVKPSKSSGWWRKKKRT